MKKIVIATVMSLSLALTGCAEMADHPVGTAVGAAALAGGAAYLMSKHEKHNDQQANEDAARNWDERHANQRHHQRHNQERVRCDDLSYDAPNWQRANCVE